MKKIRSAFGDGEFAGNHVAGKNVPARRNLCADAPGLAVVAPAAASAGARPPCLQRAQAILQALLERAADGDRLAHAFHLRGERGVGLRKFLEGKARPAIA